MKLKKAELLLFVSPLSVPVVLFGAMTCHNMASHYTGGHPRIVEAESVVTEIGPYPTKTAEQIAAVQALSALIKQHPQAHTYEIIARNPSPKDSVAFYSFDKHEVFLNLSGQPGDFSHFSSGHFSERTIHAVAAQSGDFAALVAAMKAWQKKHRLPD